jgi:hypothetical protein
MSGAPQVAWQLVESPSLLMQQTPETQSSSPSQSRTIVVPDWAHCIEPDGQAPLPKS